MIGACCRPAWRAGPAAASARARPFIAEEEYAARIGGHIAQAADLRQRIGECHRTGFERDELRVLNGAKCRIGSWLVREQNRVAGGEPDVVLGMIDQVFEPTVSPWRRALQDRDGVVSCFARSARYRDHFQQPRTTYRDRIKPRTSDVADHRRRYR